MKAHRLFVPIVFFAALAGAILLWSAHEPRYHGRSTISWLQQCYDTPLDETQRLAEAQQAIRAMPPAKVVPRLLRLVEMKEDPVSTWIIEKSEKLRIRFLQWHSAEDFQQLGIAGFEVLGTNAASGVGELTKLLDERERAFIAARCLEYIGKPAESAMCKGLTNQDSRVRALSISALASFTEDVDVYISLIKACLSDPSEDVRAAAVDGVGAQTEVPETAVPILIAALHDASGQVSAMAATSLADFGTNALSAFKALSNVVENGIGNAPAAALKTLVTIAPGEALPILTNAVARGKPSTGGALKALVAIAPEKALPILLANVRSPQPRLRHGAVTLMCSYPVKTPEIQSAIELASTDPDPMVSLGAKTYLTEQYRKDHSNEPLVPDEPSYGGKRLGEWLKMKGNPDSSFSKDAENALRQMGTNAIPALLERLVYIEPPVGLRAPEINIEAICAFIVLGQQAKPALSKLEVLMDSNDADTALHAMLATCGMGVDSMPYLIKGLTSQYADVRNEAANCLTGIPSQLSVEQRKQVRSILEKHLGDPDKFTRLTMTNALKELDTAAATKTPAKQK